MLIHDGPDGLSLMSTLGLIIQDRTMSLDVRAKTIFTVESDGPFLYFPQNSPYLVHEALSFSSDSYAETISTQGAREATPVPIANYLRFTVDAPMKDCALGFIFGSDEASCDVYVSGVRPLSRQLFAITVQPDSGALVLKVIDKKGIRVESASLGRMLVRSQRALVPEEVAITLPNFKVRLKVVDHSDHAALHSMYWTQFRQRLAISLPGLSALNLASQRPSTKRENP